MSKVSGALAALAAAAALTGCGGPAAAPSTSSTTDTPVITGDPAGHNAADVTFAQQMVDRHRQAIALTDVVPQRSTNADLTALAQRIGAQQQDQINVLNVFLVQWDQPPKMGAAMGPGGQPPAVVAQLEPLQGAAFDRLWLQSMIDEHRKSIAVADTELASGANVDAKSMATMIVSTQTAELNQMTTMLEGTP
ncbi:DUF305 domain-containing protein [Mycobacterium kyogaense]|uniref:DUF305 domain-containing protein n=1 Tax=Mycobacterium kyogaense TaxID=2212479 RepID=UPI000DACA85A|nr:DUF305 domain-containing protein [Mycobacterium kyogaense]